MGLKVHLVKSFSIEIYFAHSPLQIHKTKWLSNPWYLFWKHENTYNIIHTTNLTFQFHFPSVLDIIYAKLMIHVNSTHPRPQLLVK